MADAAPTAADAAGVMPTALGVRERSPAFQADDAGMALAACPAESTAGLADMGMRSYAERAVS